MLPLDAKVLDFAGLRRIPVPVDREGMVFTAPEGVLKPKGILVTPASQMPMSVPMADARRAAILRLALDTGAWILEEDTDGVVTLGAKPRFPIRSLPRADEAVIYMESFTLQVFPGLRLAYAVLPEPQAEALAGAKLLTDRFTSESLQAALAEYLESPGSAHHIRKMARDYRKRFALLRDALRSSLGPLGRVSETEAGPHLALLLDPTIPDTALQAALERDGITARAISSFTDAPAGTNGLLLGFGTFTEREILSGARPYRGTREGAFRRGQSPLTPFLFLKVKKNRLIRNTISRIRLESKERSHTLHAAPTALLCTLGLLGDFPYRSSPCRINNRRFP